MTRLKIELRHELRYQWTAKVVLVIVLLVLGGAIVACLGSISAAKGTHVRFSERISVFEENGVDIEQALASPSTVTVLDDGTEMIDNPLNYFYQEVGWSLQAIEQPAAMIGTVLELSSFIVLPMAFLFFGGYCATYDRRYGTLKVRSARTSWRTVIAAKALSIGVMAAIAVVSGCLSALGLLVFSRQQARELRSTDIVYDTVASESISSLAAKIGLTFGIALFFGIVGYAIGAVTNSISWPMIVAAIALFVLPFVGTWDPRNALAVVGVEVFDFWGQFKMRPALGGLEPAAAAVFLAGIAAVAILSALLLPTRSRRYS